MGIEQGLFYALSSVLLFTAFPLPTKRCATADGIYFQALMACGIWLIGAVLYSIQCASSPTGACPALVPLASLGGAVWALSNLLLVPIVGCVGVGICMLTWGCMEMLSGWAVARFGLFGLHAQPVLSPALNSAGVALGVLSLLVLSAATPAVSEGADRPGGAASGEAARTPLLPPPPSPPPSSPPALFLQQPPPALPLGAPEGEGRSLEFWESWSPLGKRAFGVGAALLAGCMSGNTFTPVQWIVDHPGRFPGAPQNLLGNLFSHFTGILFTALACLVAYCGATGSKPWVSSRLTLPALCSGLCWGLAMVFWFLANDSLSIVVAFPLVTLGPGLLSMLLGYAYFKELSGARNVLLLFTSCALFLGAAVCIALSGGGG